MNIRSAARWFAMAFSGTAQARESIIWIKNGNHSATQEVAAEKFRCSLRQHRRR